MNKPLIVVTDGMKENVFTQLKNIPEIDVHSQKNLNREDLEKILPQISGLIIRSKTKANKELLSKALSLKYIIRAGEGTDNIDKEFCKENSIVVSNTPGANGDSAAEHAIALMFTLLRKTSLADNSMKKSQWNKSLFTGYELTNKKVGIVGFGRIGKKVAKKISGFEPEILYYDHKNTKVDIPYCTQEQDLEKFLKPVTLLQSTHHLIKQAKDLLIKNSSIV